MKKILTLMIILMLMAYSNASAQHRTAREIAFSNDLRGKDNLEDIMEVVEEYYKGLEANERLDNLPKLKHWHRWALYMSNRLGVDGELVNVSDSLIKYSDFDQLNQTRTLNPNWWFIGPSSSPDYANSDVWFNGLGRINRIAFHPTNANILYAGAPVGGLWKSTNDGDTWEPLTDNLPSIGIGGIVVSYANANKIFVLTGDGDSNTGGFVDQFGYTRMSAGVFKTTDGGDTWKKTGEIPDGGQPYVGYRLVQSPDDPDIMLAATSIGIFRTTDGGNNWTSVSTGRTYDVAFKPGDGSRAYATRQGVFEYSTDGGATWITTATFDVSLCSTGRIEIATDPGNVNHVYLLSGPATAVGQFCGIWRSTNSGVSFTQRTNTPNILGREPDGQDANDQQTYDLCIAANNSVVITGGLAVWRSTNGGSTMTASTGFREDDLDEYIHPDIHDVAFNPISGDLYAATDGGFYKSEDNGLTWSDISAGIETTMFYHMAVYPSAPDAIYGGTQDNGIKGKIAAGSEFTHMLGGDGFDVQFDPNFTSTFYGTGNSSVRRFDLFGITNTVISPETSNFYKTVTTHATNSDIVFVGTDDIYKSVDQGSNWTNEAASGSWTITNCPSNSSRLYAAGGTSYNSSTGSIYRSDNTGDSWTDISNGTGFPASFGKITDVAPRPTNSMTVYAVFAGFTANQKVYRSTDGGATWANRSGTLPNIPINCVVVTSGHDVYIGTDLGVYYRDASMSDWIPWSNGLPNVPVTELVLNEEDDYITAATFGRGIWRANISTGCPTSLTIAGQVSGNSYYSATSSVTCYNYIDDGIGTSMTVRAGDRITLGTGFECKNQSKFLGLLGDCNAAGIPSITGTDTGSENAKRQHQFSDRFPFGVIHGVINNRGSSDIQFELPKASVITFSVITSDNYQEIKSTDKMKFDRGDQKYQLNTTDLTPGFYYIMLKVNGLNAHWQELWVE